MTRRRIGKGFWAWATALTTCVPTLALAQEVPPKGQTAATAGSLGETPKPPGETAKPKKPEKPEKPFELELTGTALGAYDTNIFDKGANTVQAAGTDIVLGAGIGVPLGKSVGWASGVGFGTNYRDGFGNSVGSANALRIDAHVKTGIEAVLLGKTGVPGHHVKNGVFPAIKLGLDVKYALWSNPLISQPPGLSDESVDALEPEEEEEDTESGGGGGGGEAAQAPRDHVPLMLAQAVDAAGEAPAGEAPPGEAAGGEAPPEEAETETEQPAEVSVGGQTFSNPNTHHKVTGTARLSVELSKAFSLGADGGVGRDFVQLDDNVEVSPNYNELTGGASAKCKLSSKYLWLSAGYVFERRNYDEVKVTGDSQDFSVHGAKVGIDVPLKPAKFKLSYDLRRKLADAGPNGDTTRHQMQLAVEVPIVKVLSAVAEARLTDTVFNGPADSTRFIVLAGLKFKL